MTCVTFSYEDLYLGFTNQNKPLYITSVIGNKRINWILLDCGSVFKPFIIIGVERDRDNTKSVVPDFAYNARILLGGVKSLMHYCVNS